MEQIGGLVPVNPHSSQVVAEQVIQWVAGQEAQAVWDPVGFVGYISEVGFSLSSQVANGLSALLVSSRPDSQSNAIEGMLRVLLQYKGMVNTVWLAASCTDFNIVRETCL